jgi:hypothetical protein
MTAGIGGAVLMVFDWSQIIRDARVRPGLW